MKLFAVAGISSAMAKASLLSFIVVLAFGAGALGAQKKAGTAASKTPTHDVQAINSNHLAGSQSEYLRRAIHQPVDWRPWGAEAFAQAAKLNRPVLLDVGATWCAFCELMDKESYTNPELAKFINENFVAVKVDYDADAKLSARLQRAQAYINVPSGLPLTAFVTPDGRLYTGGSYFPARPKRDKPAFYDALRKALKTYRDHDPALKNAFDLHLEKEFAHAN